MLNLRSLAADVSGTDLSDRILNRVDLHNCNLSGADLSNAEVMDAHLRGVRLTSGRLRSTRLNGSDMRDADLTQCDLTGAYLFDTDLRGAGLEDANLQRADLLRVNLTWARLRGTNFNRAKMGWAIFGGTDLASAKGLASVFHTSPSTIGVDTLLRSQHNIPAEFLRGVGLPDAVIGFLPSLSTHPIQFYSCFISYSTADQEFAERLHADHLAVIQPLRSRRWRAG